METLSPITSVDQGVHRDLRVVDRLVRSLGSTLDVGEIAARSLPILSEELGYEVSTFVLVDEIDKSLRVVGAIGDAAHVGPLRWDLDPALASRLLGTGTFLRILVEELPPALRTEGERVAFRMTDGSVTVGFVLLPGSHVIESGDPHEDILVRTVGGLIGSLISRALVHETLLRVTDRLDGARRLQQHVLDHVSHEFNTPLMILKSASEFADTDDAAERSAFLDMHQQALVRLEELVQGVLEVGQSRSDTRPRELRLGEFVDIVVQPVLDQKSWRTQSLVTCFALPEDFSAKIDVDGSALALEHLLRNAWSFGVETGARAALLIHLADETSAVPTLDDCLSALEDDSLDDLLPRRGPVEDDRLILEVIDDGIGIPEDELEHVFEPFAQAVNSPKRGVSGAGMGLPVTRKRIEAMRGSVRLDSALGRGTRVRLEIPLLRS